MVDEEAEAWNQLLEIGCKLYLYFIGFMIVLFGLLYLFLGPRILSGDWSIVYILLIGTFVWVLYWYLTRTQGGSRLLERLWAVRRRLAGVR